MPASIPLREHVLELLARDGKPVSVRDLVRRLGLAPEARRELKPVLRRLLEDGEAVKIRGTPIGRVLKVVGVITDPGVDQLVIMAKYGLPDAFPPEVEAEAARVPKEVRPQDIAGRTDFRSWATVTVDPETARDHDDAISL